LYFIYFIFFIDWPVQRTALAGFNHSFRFKIVLKFFLVFLLIFAACHILYPYFLSSEKSPNDAHVFSKSSYVTVSGIFHLVHERLPIWHSYVTRSGLVGFTIASSSFMLTAAESNPSTKYEIIVYCLRIFFALLDYRHCRSTGISRQDSRDGAFVSPKRYRKLVSLSLRGHSEKAF